MPKPTQIPVHIQGFDKTVYFPATMSPEEIERAMDEHVIPELQQLHSPTPKAPLPPTFGESHKRGWKDVGEGLMQTFLQIDDRLSNRYNRNLREHPTPAVTARETDIDRATPYTAEANRGRAEYAERRGLNPNFDWGRLSGNVAATAPIALVPGGQGVAARASLGAVAGGAMGATQFDPSNTASGRMMNAGVGAFVGGVASPVAGFIGDKLKQGVGYLSGKFSGYMAEQELRTIQALKESIDQAVPETSMLAPEARESFYSEAIEQIRSTGTLNAVELGRKANLIANGLKPTKAMVTRNPADWTLERNLQRIGANRTGDDELRRIEQELTGVYQSNDRALAERIAKMLEPLPKGTQEELGEVAMRGIARTAEDSQRAVRAGYAQVDDQFGNELASDAKNVFAALTDPKLMFNPRSKPLVEATRDYLKHMGMIDAKGQLTTKTLTASENEQLRQFVNTLDDTFGRSQILKAIDADVVSGLGQDAYGSARAAAAERFSTLDNPATQRALNTLGELQQGKTAQNFIQQQIVSGAEQDVAALLDTLGGNREALDAIQAGVLQYIDSKSINLTTGKFSGTEMNKTVEKLGPKLKLIFGDKGEAEIRSAVRAAIDSTVEPSYAAVNHSNSGSTVMSALAENIKGKARYGQVVIKPLITAAKQIHTENNAEKLLREALAARANSPTVPVNPYVKRLADALNAASAPGAVATTNSFRHQDKKRANGK